MYGEARQACGFGIVGVCSSRSAVSFFQDFFKKRYKFYGFCFLEFVGNKTGYKPRLLFTSSSSRTGRSSTKVPPESSTTPSRAPLGLTNSDDDDDEEMPTDTSSASVSQSQSEAAGTTASLTSASAP